MNTTPRASLAQQPPLHTPGNRAGAFPQSSNVTPSSHASSSSFQEDDHYNHGSHDSRHDYSQGHHPPHMNLPPIREENNRYHGNRLGLGNERNSIYDRVSHSNDQRQHDRNYGHRNEIERTRDSDHQWHSYDYGNNQTHNFSRNLKQGPSTSGPGRPPHPSGISQHSRMNHYRNGGYYYDEQPHVQAPPYEQHYNSSGESYYQGEHHHPSDRDRGQRYMSSYYRSGDSNSHLHMRDQTDAHHNHHGNDQVIFRNQHPDSHGLHPHHGSRSDDIHTYVSDEHHSSRYGNEPHRLPDYEHHNMPHGPPFPGNMNAPLQHYDAPPYDRSDHGVPYDHPVPPDGVVHMVSPNRRGRMHHHRQFSSGSESLPSYDYRPNMPPPMTYGYPVSSPMRHHYHHPQSIPIALTNSHSFESSNRSGTPPPIPQAVHPTCQSIAEVNNEDVLCGRGGGTNSQIGNRRFRKLVQEYQPEYLNARRKAKPQISRTIVQIVRRRGGRFLKKDETTGYFYEVGDERAEAKTSQALREGLEVRASASSGKRKVEESDHGRGTPVVKNTENDTNRKRDRDEEKDPSAGNEAKMNKWEEFSPPRAKAKVEEDQNKEEKTSEVKEEESKKKEDFPEHWSATPV